MLTACSEPASGPRGELALVQESEPQCAPYGTATGRAEIRIEAEGEVDPRAYGLASLRISSEALAEHGGVTLALECEPPAIGPAAPFVIPDDPATVLLPLVIVLPEATPFSVVCELASYSDEPTRTDGPQSVDCVPWSLGARVEARGLTAVNVDVVVLSE